MVTSGFILAAVWYAARFAVADQCNADGCARAVTGTFRAQTSTHRADCNSFQQCKVTPATTTLTNTVTITPSVSTSTIVETYAFTSTIQTATVPATTVLVSSPYPVFKREPAVLQHWLNPPQALIQVATASPTPTTNCPTAVPTYASACSGGLGAAQSSYSSACSCWGLTQSTTTLPSPSTTVTSTTTLPTPVTTVCTTVTTELYAVVTTTYGTLSIETNVPTCTATATKQAVGPSYCECSYTESCGKYNANTCKWPKEATSYQDCFSQCDFYVDCVGFNFDYKSNACTLCDRNATGTSVTSDKMTANAVRRKTSCGGEGGFQCYTN